MKEDNPFINSPDAYENSGRQPFRWIILGIAAAGCCILLGLSVLLIQPNLNTIVEQYLRSPTPDSHLTATAESYQATARNAGEQWPLTLIETFDDNAYDWYVGDYDDGFAKTTFEVKEGKYHWAVSAHQGAMEWIEISQESFSDFFVATEVETPSGPAYSDYGLIFRQESGSNYYYFGITSDQGFFVSINHKDQWKPLIPYAKSAAINPTGPNRLAILAQGTQFVFFINDQFVAGLTNNQIKTGKIALAIELYKADDQRIYQFDNMSLRTPPPPATPTGTITPTPTLTLPPTLTTTPHVLVTPSNRESFWEDTFDSNAHGWDIYYASDSTASVKDGKLYLTADSIGYVSLAICRDCPGHRNAFYYQAEVIPTKKTSVQHGLAFCLSPNLNEYYTFQVNSAEQSYSLYKNMPGGWSILIKITPSQLVNLYPVSNTLAILYSPGRIELYINGTLVTSFEDAQPLACEQLGIFIEEGVTEVIVDNLFAYEIRATPPKTSTP